MEPKGEWDKMPLGYQFKLINDKFIKKRNEQLKEQELTFSQNKLLVYIWHHNPQCLTQKELCEGIHVSHPTMIGILKRLYEKGYISRTENPENRRMHLIVLTEKAKDYLRNDRESLDDRDRLLVRGMSPEEIQQLRQLLGKVYENMAGF